MAKSKILDKLKLRRTRPADIEGDPVQVKVYSEKQLKEIKDKLDGKFVTVEEFCSAVTARVKETDDHRVRLDSLDRERWITRGGFMVIAAIVGWLATMLHH